MRNSARVGCIVQTCRCSSISNGSGLSRELWGEYYIRVRGSHRIEGVKSLVYVHACKYIYTYIIYIYAVLAGILINSGPPPISSSLPRAERVRGVYKSFLIDRTVHRLWPHLVRVMNESTPPYYFVYYTHVRPLFSVWLSFSVVLPRETAAMSLFSLPVTHSIICRYLHNLFSVRHSRR